MSHGARWADETRPTPPSRRSADYSGRGHRIGLFVVLWREKTVEQHPLLLASRKLVAGAANYVGEGHAGGLHAGHRRRMAAAAVGSIEQHRPVSPEDIHTRPPLKSGNAEIGTDLSVAVHTVHTLYHASTTDTPADLWYTHACLVPSRRVTCLVHTPADRSGRSHIILSRRDSKRVHPGGARWMPRTVLTPATFGAHPPMHAWYSPPMHAWYSLLS